MHVCIYMDLFNLIIVLSKLASVIVEYYSMHRNQSPASFTPNIYSLLGISNEELAFESRSFIFALLSYWFAFVF
jgi:hypothetical protein